MVENATLTVTYKTGAPSPERAETDAQRKLVSDTSGGLTYDDIADVSPFKTDAGNYGAILHVEVEQQAMSTNPEVWARELADQVSGEVYLPTDDEAPTR